jgi:hypothetical protein
MSWVHAAPLAIALLAIAIIVPWWYIGIIWPLALLCVVILIGVVRGAMELFFYLLEL